MPQKIRQLKISMKNFMLKKMVKAINNLTKDFDGFLFC